ncbi:MAG: acetyltransferase [Marivirga sp.]|nr:acetyltransferase [Marivirga sp.]
MRTPLLIYGAGGLGREVLSLANATGSFDVIGFLDDNLPRNTMIKGIKVFGGMEALNSFEGTVNIVLAFGDPVVKSEVAGKIAREKVHHPVIKHPTVILQEESTVLIGKGSILCAGSILTTDIRIGDHVLINLNCTIGHDSSIGNYSSLMPGVNVAGEVEIGACVLVGSGSNILNKVCIGRNSTIGMGSVVIREVGPKTTVVGVPAKKIHII